MKNNSIENYHLIMGYNSDQFKQEAILILDKTKYSHFNFNLAYFYFMEKNGLQHLTMTDGYGVIVFKAFPSQFTLLINRQEMRLSIIEVDCAQIKDIDNAKGNVYYPIYDKKRTHKIWTKTQHIPTLNLRKNLKKKQTKSS